MLNLKKTEIILGIFLLLLIFGVFIIKFPSFIAKATQQEVSVSITIIGSSEEELTVPASGEVEITDVVIRPTIPKITGLTNHENDKVKVRVYTSTTPAGFTAPSSTIVETVFNYINITLDTTLTNTAVIYFNVSQSDLGSTDSKDVRLYRYDSDWTELSTTVEDSTNDPVSFSATTTSFSHFLAGEKGVGVSAPAAGPGGELSHGGITIPRPEEKLVPRPKPVVEIPEKIIKVVKGEYWTILPLIIIVIFTLAMFMLISYYRHVVLKYLTNTFKALKFRTKTYFILLLFSFIVSLILLARFSFTGYTIISASVKDSFGFIIASILIILGMGIYYIKKIRNT